MKFESGYYINSSDSNYKDYRKKKFNKLAEDIINIINLSSESSILDFGCATGGLIHSFKSLGIQKVIGTDISYWAIEQGKLLFDFSNNELQHYNRNLLCNENFDIVLFLDVLEHIPTAELSKILDLVACNTICMRVPVSKSEGKDFVLDISKNDKTHIQVHTKKWWIKLFAESGFIYTKRIKEHEIYDSEGVLACIFRRVK